MFPGSFRISGHSGTDFKHRKAFKKTKELQDKRKRTSSVVIKSNFNYKISENLLHNSYEKLIKVGLFLLISVFVMQFKERMIFDPLGEYGAHGFTEKATIKEQNKRIINEQAYHVLTTTGNDYLYWNRLDEAQDEFARALKIDKNGYKANLGMTKTLMKKCKQRGEYCDEAKDYLDYMKTSNQYIDNELVELEETLVFE